MWNWNEEVIGGGGKVGIEKGDVIVEVMGGVRRWGYLRIEGLIEEGVYYGNGGGWYDGRGGEGSVEGGE